MVIYFSGTGNSRYVAEIIAIRTNDKLISANEYIKSCKKADFISDTPYIFVAPTYSWRIPRVFMSFIENGTFDGTDIAYFVLTCGDEIGNSGKYLAALCAKKNFRYKGVASIVMPENYVALFDVTDKAETKLLISQADKTVKSLSQLIMNGNDFPKEKVGIADWLKSGFINPIFYPLFVKANGFKVTDKCIGCGKCEELCPLNNIKLKDGLPQYGDCCTHCMACICACPTQAIEYGKRTVGKERYYNTSSPEITE